MPLSPSWEDIWVRLAFTVLAGAAIGFDRGARGHAAGFRTTILVCLAASVAMIQANILLPLNGKTPESFAVMDLMRLPLGILTGVGFIGGGTILKRGDLVTGVTTAATLWLVTVIGLCFGGGQLVLGIAATGLGVITLWLLKWVEFAVPRQHRATIVVVAEDNWSQIADLSHLAEEFSCRARFQSRRQAPEAGKVEYSFEIRWWLPERATPPVALIEAVSRRYIVRSFELTTDNGR